MIAKVFFFFQAEDGIRDLVRSRGLGDVYKRQVPGLEPRIHLRGRRQHRQQRDPGAGARQVQHPLQLSLIHI